MKTLILAAFKITLMKFAPYFTVYVIVLAGFTAWMVVMALDLNDREDAISNATLGGAALVSLTGSLAAMYVVHSRNNR